MNRHETDALSLTFGSVFLAIVAWWIVVRSVHIDLPSVGWFLAGALFVLGVVGLVVVVRPHRSYDARPNSSSLDLSSTS